MYHFDTQKAALSILLLASSIDAFVVPSSGTCMPHRAASLCSSSAPSRLYASPSEDAEIDDEITRLKSMAAKLRAEAAALEAEKAEELAAAAEKAFEKFDTNKDGEVSLAELKEGLEKKLKTELSEAKVKDLMSAFDTSGDGALQVDEFVGIDQFRNKLEALARDEKEAAKQAVKAAQKEAQEALLAEARLAVLNEKPPSNTDKLVSVLPYLLPLLDGLQFGRFLLEGESNPLIAILAILFSLYRSIPFGGLIAFFALNFVGSNPSINRLVRFNIQQAIFLDIALFFPSLLYAVYSLIENGLGGQISPALTELGTDAVFVTLIVTIGYAAVSSLLGITPDKVPIISETVSKRMPTIDMFDDSGKFTGRPRDDDKKKK